MATRKSHERWKGRGKDRVFWSAALTSAPVEFLDFVLPLWAASQLGAPPLQVGLIVSVEAALSMCVRPVAGILSDRFARSGVAAVGAVLYALSFLGYAVASEVWMALAAAALQGVAGALFGVAVSSKVSEGEEGSRSYGTLLSWESSGAFLGFVVGFLTLQPIGYRGVFALGAGACALAAVFLLLGRVSDTRSAGWSPPGMRDLWIRFWPLLVLRSLGLPNRSCAAVRPVRVGFSTSTASPMVEEAAREQDGREAATRPDPDHARKERRRFYGHVALFVAGQVILLAVGESWLAMILSGELPPSALWTGRMPEGTSFLTLASRAWCIVLVVDGAWSLSYTFFPRRSERR